MWITYVSTVDSYPQPVIWRGSFTARSINAGFEKCEVVFLQVREICGFSRKTTNQGWQRSRELLTCRYRSWRKYAPIERRG